MRLSVRIWLPADAHERPVPAILEYLPYRKSDSNAVDDSVRHPWYAGHGYAGVRVDIRGSGDSQGVLLDEYHPQEQLDCLEVLRWLAAQPWCTGSVGMMGISWGGFNSLQVAAHRPPELKAIITCCSTDDRYGDDVHYYGGLPLAFYLLPWASVMLAYNARPPDPATVGEGWREEWLQRIEGSPYLAETWLRHQRRDDYWRQGSVCEDYGAIEAAVYVVGGWSDGYTNAALRLLDGLSCPRKGLIGPWEHVWPEEGYPGPAIGFLQEALRFWDRWLKDEPNDVMDGPMLRYWRQESVRAARCLCDPAGSLGGRGDLAVAASHDHDPASRRRRSQRQRPATARARRCSTPAAPSVPTPARGFPTATRQTCRATSAARTPGRCASTRARSPARSRCSDSRCVSLRLSADRAVALVAVRLCEVRPDGTSTLITRGALNLCRRDGHDRSDPLEPGRDVRRRSAAEGDLLRAAARSPAPRRPLDHLLAVALAVAGARRARRPLRRGEPPRAAGASSAPRGRRPPAVRGAGDRARRSPSRGSPSATRAGRSRGTSSPVVHTLVMSRALCGLAPLPGRHHVPRPRSGPLLDRRGRPALGPGRVRADDRDRP